MNELRTSTRIYFGLWRCYKTYFRASLWNHLPVECWSSFRSFSILDDQLKIFIENILVLLERVHLFVPWECILEDVLWPPHNMWPHCCVSSATQQPNSAYCDYILNFPLQMSSSNLCNRVTCCHSVCLLVFFWKESPVCNNQDGHFLFWIFLQEEQQVWWSSLFFGTFLSYYLLL